MLLEHQQRAFKRKNYTVTNYHGVPVYIDDEGRKCPATTYIIEQMHKTGRIHPPAHSTDGYERTTSRPDIIFWIAKMRGRLVHERIAAQMDESYDWDVHPIIRDIRELNGVDASRGDVIGAIAEYRDEHRRMYPLNILERDVQSLLRAWDNWWDEIHKRSWSWNPEVVRAELGLVAEHHKWDIRWGARPDLVVYDHDEEEAAAICIKTGYRITDAHRTQAVVTMSSSPYFHRVVIVRLGIERETYETENIHYKDAREQPYPNLLSEFYEELLPIYRSIN